MGTESRFPPGEPQEVTACLTSLIRPLPFLVSRIFPHRRLMDEISESKAQNGMAREPPLLVSDDVFPALPVPLAPRPLSRRRLIHLDLDTGSPPVPWTPTRPAAPAPPPGPPASAAGRPLRPSQPPVSPESVPQPPDDLFILPGARRGIRKRRRDKTGVGTPLLPPSMSPPPLFPRAVTHTGG